MLSVSVVTLFPEVFEVPLRTSILGRAAERSLVKYEIVDLRGYSHDKHKTVDDYAFGGGAGMVLKPEPFFEALDDLKPNGPTVLLSARGKKFEHEDAVRFSVGEELTLLCGSYKDVDGRVAERDDVEELSVGDFVLTGGEFGALCVIDSVVRLLPGAIGDHESAATDSFYEGLLSAPSYTRPAVYRGLKVPEVLLGGNHVAIKRWRFQEAERLTKLRRPDLWERFNKDEPLEAGERGNGDD
ncbi:MAG: tRNA (guanosine(37)-N1)-methyltransferase TrmD [Gemmatimonadetes bacterium]|nr:tRNA (guanosine(37)-N1)-methyltransferase TrmD [Gemmatimonadota bacterium]